MNIYWEIKQLTGDLRESNQGRVHNHEGQQSYKDSGNDT